MKQPQKLTREQKIAVSAYYLNPKDWELLETYGAYIKIVNKANGKTLIIDQYARRKFQIRRTDDL